MSNAKLVTITLRRIDLCDLALACTLISQEPTAGRKWSELHDKIKEAIDLCDREYMNLETGELLTREEMLRQAAELYDLDDPTNCLDLLCYYRKV